MCRKLGGHRVRGHRTPAVERGREEREGEREGRRERGERERGRRRKSGREGGGKKERGEGGGGRQYLIPSLVPSPQLTSLT